MTASARSETAATSSAIVSEEHLRWAGFPMSGRSGGSPSLFFKQFSFVPDVVQLGAHDQQVLLVFHRSTGRSSSSRSVSQAHPQSLTLRLRTPVLSHHCFRCWMRTVLSALELSDGAGRPEVRDENPYPSSESFFTTFSTVNLPTRRRRRSFPARPGWRSG